MATTLNAPATSAGPGTSTAAAIRFVNVGKQFEGGVAAVKDLNLEIRNGELLVLLGPSGCGKTTTLNMLAGPGDAIVRPALFKDQAMNNVPPEERDIAMVFQSIALYPHLNLRVHIGLPLKTRGVPKQTIAERTAEVAAILDIGSLLNRRIHQLSGRATATGCDCQGDSPAPPALPVGRAVLESRRRLTSSDAIRAGAHSPRS